MQKEGCEECSPCLHLKQRRILVWNSEWCSKVSVILPLKIMSSLFSLKKSSAELKKILANGQVGVITC